MVLLAACAAPADTGVPAEAPPAEEEMPEEPGGGGDVHVPAAEPQTVADPAAVCKCLPEFTVDTEFGDGYGVNLTDSYVRCEAGQAPLTAEQTEEIRGILERNCT